MGFFSQGLKNKFKTAMVNDPSVFKPLKFSCVCVGHDLTFPITVTTREQSKNTNYVTALIFNWFSWNLQDIFISIYKWIIFNGVFLELLPDLLPWIIYFLDANFVSRNSTFRFQPIFIKLQINHQASWNHFLSLFPTYAVFLSSRVIALRSIQQLRCQLFNNILWKFPENVLANWIDHIYRHSSFESYDSHTFPSSLAYGLSFSLLLGCEIQNFLKQFHIFVASYKNLNFKVNGTLSGKQSAIFIIGLPYKWGSTL